MFALMAVAAVGVIAALAAVWQAREHGTALNRTSDAYEAALAVQDAGNAWLAAHAMAQQYVQAPDPVLRGYIEEARTKTFAALDEATAYEQRLGETDDVEGLITRRSEIEALYVRLFAAMDQADAGQFDQAQAAITSVGQDSASISVAFVDAVDDEQVEVAEITADASHSIDRLVVGLMISISAIALLAAGSTLFISRFGLRPLRGLMQTATALGEGDLSARADVIGPTEIQQLAGTLNVMAERVAEREKELRASEAYWRSLIQNAQDAIALIDTDGTLRFVSPAVERILGYKPEELLGTSAFDIIHPDDKAGPLEALRRVVADDGAPQSVMFRMRHKNGEWRYVDARGTVIPDSNGARVVINARDVTEQQEAQQTIRHMAYHDALTGLPNRLLMQDRFEIALAQARRANTVLAAMSVDIDRFKIVNDTLGHAAGDNLLQQVANRLKYLIRDGDTVARLGGDEFMLLLQDSGGVDECNSIASRIVEAFHEPVLLEGVPYHASVSVGLACYPDHGNDLDGLTSAADTALYTAKSSGRNTYRVFESNMVRHGRQWLELESDLRTALENDEFEVFYQPQISIGTGEVRGIEALVRWRHPQRGLIPPVEFIPIAEETGLIVRLGEIVLEKACADAVSREQAGMPPLRLSVNVAARQIERPDFVSMVADVLTRTGFTASRLELEITESTALTDIKRTGEVAHELDSMGIALSIDDFGTGSTSLRYLSDLPVRTLKIDQTFVRDCLINPGNAAIATSVIGLGHQLSMNVIAEGVETEGQLDFLTQHSCDEFQGYLYSKPVPDAELRTLLTHPEKMKPKTGKAAVQA